VGRVNVKKVLKGCLSIIFITIISIVLIISIRQGIIYLWSKKIDKKVDDREYIESLTDELSIQRRIQANLNNGQTLYLKDSRLTNEPKQFYHLDKTRYAKGFDLEEVMSMKIGIRIDDKYFEQVDLKTLHLPELTFEDENNEIIIKHNGEVSKVKPENNIDNWQLTQFNDTSLIINGYDDGKNESYLITFSDDDIEVIPLTLDNLINKNKINEFEKLLLAQSDKINDESRFLPYDIRFFWDRDKKTFHPIHDDDLLSQDGESVLLNYDDQYNNNKIVIQPTEEYIKGTDQVETIKVPRSAIKKRSSIDGIYHFGAIKILSFTSDRIIFTSFLPGVIVGHVGTLHITVDLTNKKPHYTIIYEEEI